MIVKRDFTFTPLFLSFFHCLSDFGLLKHSHIIESHGSLMKCPASHSCFESMHSTNSNENKVICQFYFNLPLEIKTDQHL